jgi:hypothetical protein
MAKRNRLTNNSDETDLTSLISGDVIFAIPFFQRSYKWKPERLAQLNEDILELVDGRSEFHFLGAVIIHGCSSNPSDPKIYEVIDGQQRITTVFLYVAAAIKVLAIAGEVDEAAGLLQKYVAIPRETSLLSNLKLHPCKGDRAQLNYVIDDLQKVKPLVEKIGTLKLKKFPVSGSDKGTLRNNYNSALRFFKRQHEQGGVERVQQVYRAMLESMSLVQIDVWDPTNGPKIFDSLNSRQEPMTVGDLVKNEIFSRITSEEINADHVEQIDHQYWQPFYRGFQREGKNLFDAYFFPFGLIKNPNIKKSEVYSQLREAWQGMQDPEHIIDDLARYQTAFTDLMCGENLQGHSKDLAAHFLNLHLAGAPTSTYPYLMQVSQSVKLGETSEQDALDVLNLVESFLVRRAVCGHEPTGLHAVFKRLWGDCDGEVNTAVVVQRIRDHKTVTWPDDDQFELSIRTRALYGVSITPYLLREYDRSLGGDQPDIPHWIEHILPENPSPAWWESFTREQHRDQKDRLANLLPVSKEMNMSVSNRPYPTKRQAYAADSMFKSARKFAEDFTGWTPETIETRANTLADWALERWPH